MTIHIGFTKGDNADYTFFDLHTNEQIAYGAYNEEGFEIIGSKSYGTELFPNAANAFSKLNERLVDEYCY